MKSSFLLVLLSSVALLPPAAQACSSSPTAASAEANIVGGQAKSKLDQLKRRTASDTAATPSRSVPDANGVGTAEQIYNHPGTKAAMDVAPAVARQAVEYAGRPVEGMAAAGAGTATGIAGTATRIGSVATGLGTGLLNPDVAIGVRELRNAAKEKNPNRGAGMPMSNTRRDRLEQAMQD